jgi:hypothetical protein
MRLFGAAVAMHSLVRYSFDSDELAAWDQSLLAARQALGEEACAQAEAEGRDMPLTQAIEAAITDPFYPS